jgi:G3E family GTPase
MRATFTTATATTKVTVACCVVLTVSKSTDRCLSRVEHSHEHSHHDSPAPQKKRVKKVHNLSLVSSVGFTIAGLLDVALFNAFMSSLLQAKAADLYRTKGVLAFANQGDTKFVFQGVHEQINFGPSERPFAADELRESKMVFIGKNIDTEYLRESLLSCCEDPATAKITTHKRA